MVQNWSGVSEKLKLNEIYNQYTYFKVLEDSRNIVFVSAGMDGVRERTVPGTGTLGGTTMV